MKVFQSCIDDGSKFGKVVYTAEVIDGVCVRNTFEVDDNSSETLAWFDAYYGKQIASSPNFSWSYDETHKTAAGRELIVTMSYSPAEVVTKAVEKEVEVTFVKASCGHMVASHLIMIASFGTSCPDCYDHLSE